MSWKHMSMTKHIFSRLAARKCGGAGAGPGLSNRGGAKDHVRALKRTSRARSAKSLMARLKGPGGSIGF